ncbi:hypothetical protein [Kytococcus sedentarius]|uniref:hypothetical protein n=1 Tax=Kytococcus sedentarius TaxID=1276 RepID=UPI00384D18E3
MNTSMTRILSVALLSGVALTACSPGEEKQSETFPLSGDTLQVVNENSHMPVNISTEGAKDGEVSVSIDSRKVGKKLNPQWSLNDGVLALGNPCKGYVGYCEGSFEVVVSQDVQVDVDGSPVN